MTVRRAFVVDNDAAKAIEPSKSALHNPAFCDGDEAPPRGWGAVSHLVLPAQRTYLLGKVALVGAVGEHDA